jgi:hypothetical protein
MKLAYIASSTSDRMRAGFASKTKGPNLRFKMMSLREGLVAQKPSVHLGCTDSKDGEAKGLATTHIRMRGEDYAPRALGRKPYRSWLRLSRSRVCQRCDLEVERVDHACQIQFARISMDEAR